MSQKLPVGNFKWVEDLSKFNESFIRNYDKNSDEGYILEVDVEYPKEILIFIKTYHFYQKEKKSINVKSLFVVRKRKKNILLI